MKRDIQLSELGEFGWIALIQKSLTPKKKKVIGIGDDTAVLPGTSKNILLTTDMILEGRHFHRSDATAYEIGRKALAVNLSDIAAMAGTPKYAVVAVGLPGNLKASYAMDILRGIKDLARLFDVEIVGGDTNRSDKIVISVTLTGEVDADRAVLRSGAQKGDWIFVSGGLGGSYASKKHLRFMPQIKLAQTLSHFVRLHAMMDISDGLVSDLGHICKESRVGAVLLAPQIPLSNSRVTLEAALTEGEDFELLFTVSDKDAQKILSSRAFRHKVYPVGRITDAHSSIHLLDKKGRRSHLPKKGFDHFKR
jgi:thiamine-monophosphate kinase